MTILLCVVTLVAVLWIAAPRKLPDFETPWCGATKGGYYRCHRPLGHEGPHLCDDLTGAVEWTEEARHEA